jgi:hypothetical protein
LGHTRSPSKKPNQKKPRHHPPPPPATSASDSPMDVSADDSL